MIAQKIMLDQHVGGYQIIVKVLEPKLKSLICGH
jgi:hypothetical protein